MAIDYRGLGFGQQYFPDEEVVDETVINTNRPILDTYQRSPHRGFGDVTTTPYMFQDMTVDEERIPGRVQEELPTKQGFQFPNFGITGIMQALSEKFQRPEAKQTAYESIMETMNPNTRIGTYGDNRYQLTDSPSGLKIGSDILGFGEGYAKNFDSMFGSKSIEEMEQKKLDWALGRLRAGKGLAQDLRGILRNRGYNDRGELINFPDRGAQITDTTVRGAIPHDTGTVTRDTSGWSSPGYTTRGGFTEPSRTTGTQHSGAGTRDVRGHHGNFSQGGRIGYANGEFVDEDVNIQGPGFDVNENIEMASAPNPLAELNAFSLEIFKKPFDQLDDDERDMLFEMMNDQAGMDQGEGIASLV